MKDLEFFHQATMNICSSLDFQRVLENSLGFLQGIIPCDSIAIGFYAPGSRILSSLASAGFWGDNRANPPVIPISKEAAAYIESRSHGQVERYNHPESHVVARHIWESMGRDAFSLMVLKLVVEEKHLGVVALMAHGFDRYTGEHERLFTLLNDPFAIAVANNLKHQEVIRLKEMLFDDNRYLNRQLYKITGDEIIGAEFGLKGVMEAVGQVASLNSQVLLLGETGVGKEVIANAIHHASPRASGPFIKVNCGAIPDTLIDSELFGHEKGAFTGASSMKRGRFERADKGTLFLDEIGELPMAAQVRLLRVLQTQVIERVGGTSPIPLDIRLIAATHRDLKTMVDQGKFREDLFFRLNVFPITIPPLRSRSEDIPALVNHFVRRKARDLKLENIPAPDRQAIELLQAYDWPGNVRELENTVERALIQNMTRSPGQALSFDFLRRLVNPSYNKVETVEAQAESSTLTLDSIVDAHIRSVLEKTSGKIQGPDGAAALLQLAPSTLRNKMNKLGIPYGRKRGKGDS